MLTIYKNTDGSYHINVSYSDGTLNLSFTGDFERLPDAERVVDEKEPFRIRLNVSLPYNEAVK